MALKVFLTDSDTGKKLRLSDDGALYANVVSAPPPAAGTSNRTQFLTGNLGSTGLGFGTTNLNVDGSVTPQSFYVEAATDYDIHIQQINIIIIDGSISHSKFGAITALTNGFDIYATESGNQTYFIQNAKTGGEVIVQSGIGKPFGDAATAFIIPNFSGNSDGMIITIPVFQFVPDGLRIGRGTSDRLTAVVKDNLTGLDGLQVVVFGYKNYPTTLA